VVITINTLGNILGNSAYNMGHIGYVSVLSVLYTINHPGSGFFFSIIPGNEMG